MAAASAAAVSNESAKPEAGPSSATSSNGSLLRHRHHHLLQLGFRAQAHQPDLAARRLLRQVRGFEQRVAGPRVEHRRQHHFVLERRARRSR